MRTPRILRAGAVAAVVMSILALTASPAAAHVLLAKAQPNGDGSATLTFTFDHGCDESPTTALIVSLPAGAAKPTRTEQPTGWRAAISDARVSWTGPPAAQGTETAFSLTTRLTGTVGQPLRFPAEQRCANGAGYQWTDPQPGDEHPAPTLIATQALLVPAPPAAAPAPPTGSAGAATRTQALAALAAFVLAAAAATAVITRRRA